MSNPNKRPAESDAAPPAQRPRVTRDRVGELSEVMVHHYMERFEIEHARRVRAEARLIELEERNSRLFQQAIALNRESIDLQTRLDTSTERSAFMETLAQDLARVLPARLRANFEGRVVFRRTPPVQRVIVFETDEEVSETESE